MIFNPLFGFYMLLGLTVIVALSATSPFMLWAALEMNMLLFLPVMASESGLALENTMKYFLVQSWASIMFLIGWALSYLVSEMASYMGFLAMMLKLGAAPIHGWFISIMKSCSIRMIIILSTLQKLIPLIILSHTYINNMGFMFFAISTFIVIFMSVLGTVSINKLLALSSMMNLIWMLLSVQIFLKLLLMFMAIYSMLLLGVNMIFKTTQTSSFMEISMISDYSKSVAVLMFMSLGGMPPLLGFLGKLLVLKTSLLFFNAAFILVLVFNSLMILFSYISRSFFILTFNPPMKSSMKEVKNSMAINIYLASLFSFSFFMIIV
uniref:NADH dehydrogenase subunit 2 n=1 Tax=Calanus simillimus TaxID=148988 RepID=UPI0020290EDD|nr:NADH dehydrogenase subunit 2 [Calanus simillimus]UPP55811.1 NADH dehydrogenase subunit 2 [Calanus simillimus]